VIAAPRARRWLRGLAGFVAAHPDLVLLAVLLVVTASVRGMFLLRAPLFVRRDSLAYLQTGYELARGQGFDLPLRRTPLYPLLIGGVVWSLGEDLRGLAFAQHLLALVTVAGTYVLGKLIFGRVAGFLAGLLVAISGPLVIYEHYILAEPLFIPLLVMGLLLTVLAMRRESAGLYLAGGVVLALAALSRPIGQALVPVAPLAILAQHCRWRPALKPACLVLLGFALVLVPWIARGALESGRVGSAGALGQTLVGRIVRHDEGFVIPDPDSPTSETDPRKIDARRLILAQMGRDARPSAINHRLQEQLGLGEAEANSAMQ
jgi:4-amino-4-deoxy-L-arabinose transferase-like glycosyltransferase